MSEFIRTVDILGEDAVAAAIIDRTITELVDDRITKVRKYAFYGCKALTKVDMPKLATIEHVAFNGCGALQSLILRGETVCDLWPKTNYAVSGLHNSGISKGTGYVYVPDNLVDSYKAATGWSDYASQIRPLSELTDNA